MLGMPDIELQGIIAINYNPIDRESSTEWISRRQAEEWCGTNTIQDSNLNNDTYTMVSNNNNSHTAYFLPGQGKEADWMASAYALQQMHNKFKHYFFLQRGGFGGIFSLQIQEKKNYSRHHQYALHMYYKSHPKKN